MKYFMIIYMLSFLLGMFLEAHADSFESSAPEQTQQASIKLDNSARMALKKACVDNRCVARGNRDAQIKCETPAFCDCIAKAHLAGAKEITQTEYGVKQMEWAIKLYSTKSKDEWQKLYDEYDQRDDDNIFREQCAIKLKLIKNPKSGAVGNGSASGS